MAVTGRCYRVKALDRNGPGILCCWPAGCPGERHWTSVQLFSFIWRTKGDSENRALHNEIATERYWSLKAPMLKKDIVGCCRLNVWVPAKFDSHAEILTSVWSYLEVGAFGRRLDREGWALMNGISACVRRAQRAGYCLPAMWGHYEKSALCKLKWAALTGTQSC